MTVGWGDGGVGVGWRWGWGGGGVTVGWRWGDGGVEVG